MKWLSRQRYFIDFTLSSLLRRKGKNISLVLVYATVVFLIASVLFFASAIRKEAETVLHDTPELIVQRLMAGRHDLIPLKYIETVKSIRGVRGVKARFWGYYFHQASKANYTVMAADDLSLKNNEAVVGSGVARTWGTVRENRLYFRGLQGEPLILNIKDELDADHDLVAADLILVSEETFKDLFGIPEGYATDLVASIRNPSEAVTIAEKLAVLLPDTRPVLKNDILRTYQSLFDWRSGYVLVILSSSIFAFCIFAWDKATGLSADEKSEIGILKALGWDTADILKLKFWEGLVVCLSAFLLGVIGGYIHVFFADATFFEHALKGWAVLYPSFKLRPQVNPFQVAVIFALTIIPYTLATIIPAWKVSVMDPDRVMRQSG